MDIENYITSRVDDAIKWYDKKSCKYQRLYKIMQTIEICAAALIPLLSGYITKYPIFTVAVGVVGVIITIIEGITKLNKYHENWIEYRSTCELLKYQKYLFLTRSFPYITDKETIENLFVKNIEQLISAENNQWKILFKSSGENGNKPV